MPDAAMPVDAPAAPAPGRPLLRRAGIFGVFLLCGGLVGGLGVLIVAFAAALPDMIANPGGGGDTLRGVGVVLAFAIVIGTPFAAVTGLIYASLPALLQRIVFAPILAVIASGLLWLVGLRANFGPNEPWLILGASAFAALVCAWIARRLGLDAIGAQARG